MGKESMTTAERVEADYAKAQTQLKAAHGKEDAALKAEESEKSAALKAEHAASGGKTGFLAKLTGKEDPVHKAESQHLKAEINRAEQQTKAAHTTEKAELDAAKQKELASAQAADKMHNMSLHDNRSGALNNAAPGTFNNGTALNKDGAAYAPSNYNAGPGHHINPNVASNAAGLAGPLTDADKKIYNHATGTYGQAALEDGRRQDAEINPSRHHHEQQQQFVPQAIGAVPMAVMPGQQVMGSQPMMGSEQHVMGTQPMMGSYQPMMGSEQHIMGAHQPAMGSQQHVISSQQPMMGSEQPLTGSQHAGHFSR